MLRCYERHRCPHPTGHSWCLENHCFRWWICPPWPQPWHQDINPATPTWQTPHRATVFLHLQFTIFKNINMNEIHHEEIQNRLLTYHNSFQTSELKVWHIFRSLQDRKYSLATCDPIHQNASQLQQHTATVYFFEVFPRTRNTKLLMSAV